MVMDRHGRNHRPSGLPQGYAGTYDGGACASGVMDVTPPASYRDGRMSEAERADWAEGMDAMRDRHVDAPALPHGLKPGRWHDEFGMNTSHAGGCTLTLGNGADPDVRIVNRSRIVSLPLSVVRTRLGGPNPEFDFGDGTWRPDPDELADLRDTFGIRQKTGHAGQIRRLLGDDPVEGSISSVAGMFPGPNARLYADFVRHPRRRTYTLEGETMPRSQARDYARGMFVESARNDARAWGDGYDPDAMAEQAGDWFDRTYSMPKRR